VPSHGYVDRRTVRNRCDSPTRGATARAGCDTAAERFDYPMFSVPLTSAR